MRFIDNAHQWWRLWSMRLGAIGTLLTSYLILSPDAAINAWSQLPADLRAAFPVKWVQMAGVAVWVVAMISRMVKQTKLQNPLPPAPPPSEPSP